MTSVSMFAATSVHAATPPKLAAPIYNGAVPAVLADSAKVADFYTADFGGIKALDCDGFNSPWDYGLGGSHTAEEAKEAGYVPGPWCFLTTDPIDRVKAFYEQAIGPMQVINGTWGRTSSTPVQGYVVYAERAWFPGSGESPPGFGYAGVSLHALPPPPVKGKAAKTSEDSWEGQESYQFYAETRHFGGFLDAVDWFGDPSKRKPAELDALYQKYNHLEAALFQHKGPKSEAVDETLRARYSEMQQQAMAKANSAMAPSEEQIAQMMQAAQATTPASQQATPEDDEFNAYMQRNPKVAKRYTELTGKIGTLMQQGRFDEADATDAELQALIDSNPELAALERRADERAAAAAPQGNFAMAGFGQQQGGASWDTWLKYLTDLDKEDYSTLIVIDLAYRGDEKDYSRDPALFARETAGMVPHQLAWGFSYREGQTGQAASQASGPAMSQDKQETGVIQSPAGGPAPSQDKPETGTVQEDVGNSVKKGLNVLKGLW